MSESGKPILIDKINTGQPSKAIILKKDIDILGTVKFISKKQPKTFTNFQDYKITGTTSTRQTQTQAYKTKGLLDKKLYFPSIQERVTTQEAINTAISKELIKQESKTILSNKIKSSVLSSSLILRNKETKETPKINLKTNLILKPIYKTSTSLKVYQTQALNQNQKLTQTSLLKQSTTQRLNSRQAQTPTQTPTLRQRLNLRFNFKIPSKEINKIRTPFINPPKVKEGFSKFPLKISLATKRPKETGRTKKGSYETYVLAPDLTARISNAKVIIKKTNLEQELKRLSSGIGVKRIPVIR